MPTSTRTKAAKTTAAADKAKAVFYSVGALFSRDNGSDLILEREFLDSLGFQTEDGKRYALHLRHKTGKSGRPYTSVFICEADED